MKKFDSYSKYYDIFNEEKNYKQEADYVLNLIEKYSPNSKSLLEFGCGTAMHALHFAKKYAVCGVDLSSTMLEKASHTLRNNNIDESRVKLICDDISKVTINEKFDVCVSLFHVMSYMSENDKIFSVFKNAHKHLKKNGIFIFDCWYGPAVLKQRPTQRIKKINRDDNQYIRLAEPELKIHKNTVDVHYQILDLNNKTNQFNSLKELHSMRYYFEPEIQFFCELSSFELLNSYAWLTKADPSEDNWGACFVLKAL